MKANLNAKDNEDLRPLDIILRNVDLLPVEYILYSRFPPNYNPYNNSEISLNKLNKKFKTDVSLTSEVFIVMLNRHCLKSVSYTHLTLPTIYSV